MFCTLFQQHLAEGRKCELRFGSLIHPYLVPQVKLRINVRMQIFELDLPAVSD
jgi:hypothetical protein